MKWLLNLIITSMLFFPDKEFDLLPQGLGLRAEDACFETEDGKKIFGWYLPAADPKATIVLFHGNAGNISYRLSKAKGWIDRGVSVFLVDYRGFGKSEGKIAGEKDLYRDAEASLKWLREKKGILSSGIILYGESIGSGPAIELGRREKFRGIILEAPFTSLLDLARVFYPWLSAPLLGDFEIRNLEKVPGVRAPVFLLHGRDDEICPFAMGEKIFAAAPSPKGFLPVSGGHHNDLRDIAGDEFFDAPYQFFFGNTGSSSEG